MYTSAETGSGLQQPDMGAEPAAMLVCVWMFLLTDASSVEDVKEVFTRSGEPVLLTSDLLGEPSPGDDFRWTRPPDVVAKDRAITEDFRGYCELLSNGSLWFRRAQPGDSGRYFLQVFDDGGKRHIKKEFLLTVIEPLSQPVMTASCTLDGRLSLSCSVNQGQTVLTGQTTTAVTATTGLANQTVLLPSASSHWSTLLLGREVNGSVLCVAKNNLSVKESAPVWLRCHDHQWTVVISALVCFFPFLLSFLFFILRKRRSQRTSTTDPLEDKDNMYVVMHSYHGDSKKDEDEEKKGRASCDPVISMETPITLQISEVSDDIYV
ncbi:hypothetical protein LDENG_00245020 [Lucifuga dentata]|nr:hypothetical protein LDENG_00245020 [Lucifuga dentata]